MSVVNEPSPRIGTVMRAPKTAELIATHLRRQIVRGELAPGQTLPPELQLMEQFGVSRPTLREAFRILEAESLINVRRGSRGGAQVMAPDVSVAARYVGLILQIQGTTIDDVYEARMVTEPTCARLFAEVCPTEAIAELEGIVSALEREVAAQDALHPDPDKWTKLTYRFHEILLEGCGNKTLALQGAVLQDIVATHLRTRLSADPGPNDPPERFKHVIRSYQKLIALVRAGDGPGAEKHWRGHMEGAAQYLLRDEMRTKPVVDLFT